MALTPQQIEAMSKATGLKYSSTPVGVPSLADKIRALKPKEEKKTSFYEKALNAGTAVTEFLGGKGVADTFGTAIAKIGKSDEEKAILDSEAPTLKETIGSGLQLGSLFIPVGGVSKGVASGVAKVAPRVAKTVGNMVAGGVAGGAFDVGEKLQTGETSGLGTVVGTTIPLAGPIVKGVSKLAGRAAGETLGKTTGAGYGAIKEGFEAAKAGGERAKTFASSLRGQTSPEAVVEEARSGLGDIIKQRSKEYTDNLGKIKTKTNVIDHTPIIEKYNKKLEDFGVLPKADGTGDFTRAPGLGRYEKDLKALSQTLAEWGTREGDNTIAGVDKLKQVIDDFRIGSPDSRKFDSFINELRGEAKNLIKENLTKAGDTETLSVYEKMLSDYESKTGIIKEIQKGLSLGDKASIDTSFRKLSSVLRQNNEFRQELVQELDKVTGGNLLSKIAGQQLNPLLPRGLSGVVGTIGGAGALTTGVGLAKLLPAMIAFSPRAVGELVNALGFTGKVASELTEYLVKNAGKLQAPGDTAIQGLKQDIQTYKDIPNKERGFVAMPNPFSKGTVAKTTWNKYPKALRQEMKDAYDYLSKKTVEGKIDLVMEDDIENFMRVVENGSAKETDLKEAIRLQKILRGE